MKPIAIFFHCAFLGLDGHARPVDLFPGGVELVLEYIQDLQDSGLMDAAERILMCVNGGEESRDYGNICLPRGKKISHIYHGADWRSSNATTELIRTFSVDHPGWNILRFHSKGIAHEIPEYATYHDFEWRWVDCMVNACIKNWRTCVADLENLDAVGCHWMENVGSPPVDHIFGGNFWWATSDFLATKPPLSECPLVKQFGIKHYESRATDEQYIGIGPKPRVKDYCISGINSHM